MKPKMTVYQMGGKMPIVPDEPKKKEVCLQLTRSSATRSLTAARSREAENLTEMRNALKAEGPEELAKFDKELKAKGFKVVKKPVKKMMGGGKMNVDGYYEKGGKMPKYGKGGMMKYLKGGQVKLDKNKDGKISGEDFKMMAKKK
jgi:hypothetical protein